MLPALILALAALGIAAVRLWSYRAQMLEMARILEETPAESNLRLTVRMSGGAPRRLCRAVNARLEAGRRLHLEALRRERELKYTMACISHDIRTPLAGAMGYLQLLEGAPDRQGEYLGIVQKRLEDLEALLEDLIQDYHANRRRVAAVLLKGLEFVNKNDQPLHMMPKLQLDLALLEQPLYH